MAQAATTFRRSHGSDLAARGEPFLWGMGGALAFGMTMIIGFVAMVLYFGLTTFWPKPIEVVTLVDGKVIAGEPLRQERYRPTADQLAAESETVRQAIVADLGPKDKIGEGSLELARRLGIDSDPKNGGRSEDDILYIAFPGSGNKKGQSLSRIETLAKSQFDAWGGMDRVNALPKLA